MANKELEKRAKKIADKILTEMTYNIAFEIESAYERIINKFYEDYKPLYYQRTYSTYSASDIYGDIFRGVKSTSNGYQIGISVSSSYIDGDPYEMNKEDVFHRTFVEGVHGFSSDDGWSGSFKNVPPKTSPSPKEQMDDWFENFKKDSKQFEKIKQDAIKRAMRK